jgi:hypothetical protein
MAEFIITGTDDPTPLFKATAKDLNSLITWLAKNWDVSESTVTENHEFVDITDVEIIEVPETWRPPEE